MKHCLNCYRKIPNDAAVCHYCGAPQVEKGAPPVSGVTRCPNCLSYLYSETSGCQKCGYVPTPKKKSVRGIVLGTAAALFFSGFALWQLGVLTFLPSPGRLAESIQATGESITLLDFRLSALDEDRDAAGPTPTVYGDPSEAVVLLDAPLEEMTALPEAAAVSEAAAAESFAAMTTGSEPATAVPEAPVIVSMATETLAEPVEEATAADATEIPPTIVPTVDSAFRCGDMRHQFEAGAAGVLSGSSIKVRSEPKTTGEQLTILRAGMMFQALDAEPVCDGKYMWIKIHVADENVTGWTVEADDRYYWVVPAK